MFWRALSKQSKMVARGGIRGGTSIPASEVNYILSLTQKITRKSFIKYWNIGNNKF